jgi:hypothetical protein
MKDSMIAVLIVAVMASASNAWASIITYAIVDYPTYQVDTVTGLVDHVSGTITADPTTGALLSASFTITGATSYTVASATINASVNVSVTPTEIILTQAAPYGFLDLKGSTGVSGANSTADLQWYTPANPWVVGTMDWAGYMGTVGSKGSGPLFASGQVAPEFTFYPWVVATVVPEPGALALLSLAGLAGLAAMWIRRRVPVKRV